MSAVHAAAPVPAAPAAAWKPAILSQTSSGSPVLVLVPASLSLLATCMFAAAEGLEHTVVALLWGTGLLLLGRMLVRRMVTVDRTLCLRLFTGGFLARYAFAAFVRTALAWSGSPVLAGGSDYLSYDTYGWAQAQVWRSGDFSWIITYTDAGYYYLVAAVYTITGHYVMAPTLVSALFGGLAAVVTYLLGRRLFGSRVGLLAGLLTAFIPTLLFWSSLLYKDTIIAFLMTVAVYLAVNLRERFSASRAVALTVMLGPLFVLRSGMAAVVVVLIGGLLLTGSRGLIKRRLPTALLAGATLAIVLVLLQRTQLGAGGVAQGLQSAVVMIRDPLAGFHGVVMERGGPEGFSRAIYGKDLLRSPHLLLAGLGMLYVTPVPGVGGMRMNFATFLAPGQIVWIFLLPALLLGVWKVVRRRQPVELFLLAVCAAGSLATVMGGFFSNPRYLVQVVPMLLILMALGVHRLGRNWFAYLAATCAGVCLLAFYTLARSGGA